MKLYDIIYNFISNILLSTDNADLLAFNNSLSVVLSAITICLIYVVIIKLIVFIFNFFFYGGR